VPAKMNPDEIHEFWKQHAEQVGTGYMASCKDLWLMQLENKAVADWLWGRVVDMGCCNGMSTLSYAMLKSVNVVTGVDNCEKMLSVAKQLHRQQRTTGMAACHFIQADVRDTKMPDQSNDCVLFKRVLCNLYNWENQAKALDEAMRISRQTIVLVEPFSEGEHKFNMLRRQFGLVDQLMPSMCHYPRESVVTDYMNQHGFKLSHRPDPFSTYFLLTRFFCLLVDDVEVAKEQVATPFHEMARDLPSWGEWSNQKLLVFDRPRAGS